MKTARKRQNYIGRTASQDGPNTTWHENGKRWTEAYYKDGEQDGPYARWYENGQKREVGTYKNGKQDGLKAEWDENGNRRGSNKVLVVDSHRVYLDLGRDLADLQTMQKEKRRLEDELKAAQQQVQEEIAAKEAEFGKNPTEEQNQLLAAMNRDAAMKMQVENFQDAKNVNQNGTTASRSISPRNQTDRR